MTPVIYFVFGLLVLGIVISLLWRISSIRQKLPCPAWLGWMVELDNPFTKANRAHVIVEYLKIAPNMKVLDAGCGPGRLTLPLAEAVGPEGEVLALDIQSGMLDRVRHKLQTAGFKNVQYLQSELGAGLLQAEYYDRAVLVTVLGEIPDQASALKEIFNTLKPGGILSVTEVIFDPHFQSAKAVLKVAETVGFHQKNFFGKQLAYNMHLEKPVAA